MALQIFERIFPVDPSGLLEPLTPDNEPFWAALAHGELTAQQCASCQKMRFPIMPVCPHCGSTNWHWQPLSGRGRIFSWVRNHNNILPEYADVAPYVIAVVQLDEGIRMTGRLIEDGRPPASGAPVIASIERWPNGRHVPAFRLEPR